MRARTAVLLLGLTFFWLAPKAVMAACNPPSDYSDCQNLNPDTNLSVRGYTTTTGDKNYFDFNHPIDSKAPQLNNLISGNPNPTISNLYRVNDWNWTTNSVGGPITNSDTPVTAVGLSTTPGQSVNVPNSGYDIGGGYQAVILYATANSMTIHYTPDDNVVAGYTVQLSNFAVDPTLLAAYQKSDVAGRSQLVAVSGGQSLGKTTGELILAMRDTGQYMDPRWKNDWWHGPGSVTSKNPPSLVPAGEPFQPSFRKANYCETPAFATYPDESLATCPGDTCNPGGKPAPEADIMPTYHQADGSQTPELRPGADFQFGIGVQGLSCGQARGDSFAFAEQAPYDLFSKKQPDFCEQPHEWTGESMPSNINIPFAQQLAERWGGTLDAEHYSEAQLADLRAKADIANVKTDADLENYFLANKLMWEKSGVVSRLLPAGQIDELKAGFVRYVKQRHGQTLYADFTINGVKISDIDDPPVKPDPGVLAVNPALLTTYQQDLTAWADKWRSTLDDMGVFPNEQARSQIKVVLCGDREYQDVAMDPGYPEVMKMGLSANTIFQTLEPKESQDAFYKQQPMMKDPYKYLNQGYVTENINPDTQLASAPEVTPPAPVLAPAVTANPATVVPPPSFWDRAKNWLTQLLPHPTITALAGDAGQCFHLTASPIAKPATDGGADVSFNVYLTEEPNVKKGGHFWFWEDGNQTMDHVVYDPRRVTNYLIDSRSTGPAMHLAPNSCASRTFYAKMDECGSDNPKKDFTNDGGLTCQICAGADGKISADNVKCSAGVPLVQKQTEFPTCDPKVACCPTDKFCQPKEFKYVRYGPPYTIKGDGTGDLDYGVTWAPSGPVEDGVKLTFIKEDWHNYTAKTNSLPGDCRYKSLSKIERDEAQTCSTNGSCSSWGSSYGEGCNGQGLCAPVICTHPYTRTADVYNNVPYLYSLWQEIAGQAGTSGMPPGVLTLLKPGAPETVKAALAGNSGNTGDSNPAPAQIAGTGCSTKESEIMDAAGNFLKTPAAAVLDWGYFSTSINGQPPHLIDIDVSYSGPTKRNLLFYRLGGVCNADTWFSQKVLQPTQNF